MSLQVQQFLLQTTAEEFVDIYYKICSSSSVGNIWKCIPFTQYYYYTFLFFINYVFRTSVLCVEYVRILRVHYFIMLYIIIISDVSIVKISGHCIAAVIHTHTQRASKYAFPNSVPTLIYDDDEDHLILIVFSYRRCRVYPQD